ncbi:restriction endonuclease [Pedobacter gandavensis]|uniref:restriction endonuclease n=1 Tax=Pedobacter gandavensis TaxID=2679963 RepID=UPI003D7C1FE7
MACECKYWTAAIPQDVIFGFRTKVNDIGANIGLIISSSKFQSGAISAIDRTNVSLLTWDEFQTQYFDTWDIKYFYVQLRDTINIYFVIQL